MTLLKLHPVPHNQSVPLQNKGEILDPNPFSDLDGGDRREAIFKDDVDRGRFVAGTEGWFMRGDAGGQFLACASNV